MAKCPECHYNVGHVRKCSVGKAAAREARITEYMAVLHAWRDYIGPETLYGFLADYVDSLAKAGE